MKYKLLILIFSLLAINVSFAKEEGKSNYFGDDNFSQPREIKNNKKKELKYRTSSPNLREKREGGKLRVKLRTDTH